MAYRGAFLNFSKGVISPELRARFDISVYHAALKRAENVIVLRTGGVTKRPGTRFVAECLTSTAERLIPFQFSDEQAYALEHAQALMRPLALGGAVLEETLAVSAITQAANAQVTVAFHGYVAGDPVYFIGIEGMTEINGRFLTVVNVIDANNFTVNFNSTSAGAFTGSGGGTVRSGPPDPPAPDPTVAPVIVEPEAPIVAGGGGGGYSVIGKYLSDLLGDPIR